MKLILGILIVFILLVVIAYFFQRRLTYFPPPNTPRFMVEAAEMAGFVPWEKAGVCMGYIYRHPKPLATVMLFHGNADQALGMLPFARGFQRFPLSIALFEYPGYSHCPGSPSESSITTSAQLAYAELSDAGDPVILAGQSLGAAVAAKLAQVYTPNGLILISPFSALQDIAQVHYPFLFPKYLLMERWDSFRYLQGITAPLLVIHGESDDIVPQRLGRKLYDAYQGPKTFVSVPQRGHNDLPLHDTASKIWTSIDDFLSPILK